MKTKTRKPERKKTGQEAFYLVSESVVRKLMVCILSDLEWDREAYWDVLFNQLRERFDEDDLKAIRLAPRLTIGDLARAIPDEKCALRIINRLPDSD